MKLSKKLLKNFSVIAVVSILLTAVFSTAAFWFVFSDEQETEVRNIPIKSSAFIIPTAKSTFQNITG